MNQVSGRLLSQMDIEQVHNTYFRNTCPSVIEKQEIFVLK